MRTAAPTILSFFVERKKVLNQFLKESEGQQTIASEKTRAFWKERLAHADELHFVLATADKEETALSADQKAGRAKYFQLANTYWQVNLKKVLATIDRDVTGPFALGVFRRRLAYTKC